jgi:sterol desaturase/sphingolipid hydroxylase (fatty acid hydroxylase superfamily)
LTPSGGREIVGLRDQRRWESMSFAQAVVHSGRGLFPAVFVWTVLPLLPFVILEQLRPAGARPRWRDYVLNVLISLSTSVMMVPVGVAAGLASRGLRAHLPWTPLAFSFDRIARLPVGGRALELLAMVLVPLLLHDLWFYWAHRIEHRVGFLWELHKLHHSDDRMNCSTFARDQLGQAVWTAFFPLFTLGLLVDLDLRQAGQAAYYSNVFFVGWTMFCHSAVRVRLPWLDAVLVTPQVHRLHHSADPAHHNTNFADVLPIFDILFGTYRRPRRDEFPATGLSGVPAPRSPWGAQLGPLIALRAWARRRS